MKKFYNTFLIIAIFMGFGLSIAPITASAWYGSYPSVNLGYNSPRDGYYNNYRDYRNNNNYRYDNGYNNRSSYNDVYYGGNSNDYYTPSYDMNYGYQGFNNNYQNYNNNNNYNNYGNYNNYYQPYTVSGWSRSYSYCTGMYCSQY